jgi:hypothetical protein
MNKNTYLSLALATCMGLVSAPLFAEVTPAPEHPANIMAPATTATEHQEAAALHKPHAEQHKSLAAEYKKAGHHEALTKKHEKWRSRTIASPQESTQSNLFGLSCV